MNYTYDKDRDKYICHENPKCSKANEKYIPDTKECLIDCKSSSIYKYEFKKICYKDCPIGTEKSEDREYSCDIKCTNDYPYLHIQSQQCIKDCSVAEMFTKICKINYKDANSTQNEKLNKKIIEDILNGNLGPLLSEILDGNNTYMIKDENDAHFISTIKGQLSTINFSSVDFGECEKYLRNVSGIGDDEELIMYKIEHYVEGFNIPIIEYVLFTQDGKKQLNLSLCEDMKIQYYIPVNINENDMDKYNPDSDFYNDECNTYKSENGVDLTLYDRKNEFNKNNMSLCEKGCTYKNYIPETHQAECDCNIKSDMDYSNEDIAQKVLLNQIELEKSSSNLKITQCTNVLTSPEQLQSNSGFFLLLIILIIFIIVFILFCTKGRRMLEEKADEVIYKKFKKDKRKKSTDELIEKNDKKNVSNKIKKNKKRKSKHKSLKQTKAIKTENPEIKIPNSRNSMVNITNNRKQNLLDFNKNKKSIFKKGLKTLRTKLENSGKNEEEDIPDKDNNYELNISSYIMAIKYDKRSCCEYYTALLKNKQIFMFTFCSFNDYNSGIIKKFIFFLSFSVHYTANALFFTEDNFHQIYEDNGSFNFTYQLPKILISAIASTLFLRIILETLVLTDRNILQIKRQKTYMDAKMMEQKTLKYINIKFALFFIINFILLVLFWYYLTIFNALFANSQVYLIENTAISFAISLFYPVFWNIIPSVLRICSLGSENGDKQCIYSLSKILQVI